jgi:hypothetical protein
MSMSLRSGPFQHCVEWNRAPCECTAKASDHSTTTTPTTARRGTPNAVDHQDDRHADGHRQEERHVSIEPQPVRVAGPPLGPISRHGASTASADRRKIAAGRPASLTARERRSNTDVTTGTSTRPAPG